MANAYSGTTPWSSQPYLTLDEYKAAPTAIDYDNLVIGSSSGAVQDAELSNVIMRASAWMDEYCQQPLGATVQQERLRSRLKSDGTIRLHPRYGPIVALTAFSYGFTPNGLVTYPDCSQAWVEDFEIVIPYSANNLSYSSAGPLEFGLPSLPRAEIFASVSYVAGFSNTVMAATANIGATSITVESGLGILPNSNLTIYDGSATETVMVDDSYVFGSTTVPLVAPLLFAHGAGAGVSALPSSLKQAAILVTTAFLKVRGDGSMTMSISNQPALSGFDNPSHDNDLELAKQLLKRYRRIR